MALGVVLEDDFVLVDDDSQGVAQFNCISPEPEEAQVLKFTNHKGEEEERIVTKRTDNKNKDLEIDENFFENKKVQIKNLPEKQISSLIQDIQNRCVDLAQQIMKRFITDTRTQREIAFLIITIARGENGLFDYDRDKLRRLYKITVRDEKEFERCISEIPQHCLDTSQDLQFDPVWRKYTKEGELISDFGKGKNNKRSKYKTNIEIEVQKSVVERKVVKDIVKIQEARKVERSRSASKDITLKSPRDGKVVEGMVKELERIEKQKTLIKDKENIDDYELQNSKILNLNISYHKEINKKGPEVIEKIVEADGEEGSSANYFSSNFNSIFAFGKNSHVQQIDLDSMKSDENRIIKNEIKTSNPYDFHSIGNSFKSINIDNKNQGSSTFNGYEFSSANFNQNNKIVEDISDFPYEKIELKKQRKDNSVPALDLKRLM